MLGAGSKIDARRQAILNDRGDHDQALLEASTTGCAIITSS
jgi:hypothetical protein